MTGRLSRAFARGLPILAGLGVALGTTLAAEPAPAGTIIEVNKETRQTYVDCGAAWARLKGEYRQGARRACGDAGGVEAVTEPKTGKKPVGGKFICTLQGRILCRK